MSFVVTLFDWVLEVRCKSQYPSTDFDVYVINNAADLLANLKEL